MTLIITLATSEYVLQVSDRRFSIDGKAMAEEDNKAVFFNGMSVWAYTGIGDIQVTKRTDEWLAQTLNPAASNYSYEQGVADVTREAGKALQLRPRLSRTDKRLAFVVAGWRYLEGRPHLVPHVTLISNCHSLRGKQLGQANDVFQWGSQPLTDDPPFVLNFTGRNVPEPIWSRLRSAVTESVRKRVHPELVSQVLIKTIREVSVRNPQVVGPNVLVSCIPVSTLAVPAGGPHTVIVGTPRLEEQSFYYEPVDGRLDKQLSPYIVMPGGATWADLKWGPTE